MSILEQIFGIFGNMIEWLVGAVNDVVPLFYNAESGLTFVGTLAVVALAMSVVFLLIGIISRFLKFRG